MPDPISVEHAPTRLVVDSPGSLVSGVTVENILAHPSKPRNRLLTEVIRKLGLAEQAGVGIDRIYRDMIRSGHEPPKITSPTTCEWCSGGGPPTGHSLDTSRRCPRSRPTTSTRCSCCLRSCRTGRWPPPGLERVLQKPTEEVEAVLRSLAADDVAMLESTRQTARRRHPAYRFREHVLRKTRDSGDLSPLHRR